MFTLFRRMKMKEKIAFLNGFFECLASLLSYCNCSYNFYLENIIAHNSLQETIEKHFEPYFSLLKSKTLSKQHHDAVIQYHEVSDWNNELNTQLKYWLYQLNEDQHFKLNSLETHEYLFTRINQLLQDLFKDKVSAWRVLNGSDDIHSTEFILQTSDRYYLLHFGLND